MSESEVAELQQKIAELERQLVEEREEFEWDTKATQETVEANTRKLEEEIRQLRAAATTAGAPSLDVQVLTQRALVAERRVAELQEELRRARAAPPPSATTREDGLLRQRAEAAEAERDELRRELRALQRKAEERERAERRLQEQVATLEQHKERQAVLERELQQTKDFLSASQSKVRELADKLEGAVDQGQVKELELDVERLNAELARTQLATGQMVEQRERETARLKRDLEQSETTRGSTDVRLRTLDAESRRVRERLERELVEAREERDAALAQLRALREREPTTVGPAAGSIQRPDPFDERTVRVTMGGSSDMFEERTVRANPLSAAVPVAVVATDPGPGVPIEPEDGPLEPAVAPELVGAPEGDVFPEAEPGSAPAGYPAAFAPGGTAHGEPPPPEEQELAEMQELLVEAEPVPIGAVETQRQPRPVFPRQPARAGGLAWKPLAIGLGGLVGMTLIILGALHFFPIWFGLGAVEGEFLADAGSAPDGESASAAADQAPGEVEPVEPPVALAVDAGAEPVPEPADGTALAPEPVETPALPPAGPEDKPAEPDPKLKETQATGLRLLQKKRYDQAERLLKPWVKKVPDDPQLRYLYGRCLFYQKKQAAALAQMEKAIQLDPTHADTYYELGGMYLRQKDKARARAALEKFVELLPDDKRTPAVRKLLQRL